MKEIKSLIDKAQRYIKSAKLLLDDDPESAVSRVTFAIEPGEAELLLQSGTDFVNVVTGWIRKQV